jgi:hypothetical protein
MHWYFIFNNLLIKIYNQIIYFHDVKIYFLYFKRITDFKKYILLIYNKTKLERNEKMREWTQDKE